MDEFTVRTDLDQHFLIDNRMVEILVKTAEITTDDVVLEIGCGRGAITEELVKTRGRIMGTEVDKRFFGLLEKLPIELLKENALNVLKKRCEITKVIGNIPFQITEPLMHALCVSRNIINAVLILPKTFSVRIEQNQIFSAFFDMELIEDVPRDAFEPKPRGASAIMKLVKKKEVDKTFVIRKIYLQREKKLGNALRDGLIDYLRAKGKKMTKKEAMDWIEKCCLDEKLLEIEVKRMILDDYRKISLEIEMIVKNI